MCSIRRRTEPTSRTWSASANRIGDDVGATADDDHVADLGQVEDRVRSLAYEGPAGRTQSEQFVEGIGDLGDPIFGHGTGESFGKMLFLEDLGHEVPIEHRPRR